MAGSESSMEVIFLTLLFTANINDLDVGNKLIDFADTTKSKIEIIAEQQLKHKTDLDLLLSSLKESKWNCMSTSGK